MSRWSSYLLPSSLLAQVAEATVAGGDGETPAAPADVTLTVDPAVSSQPLPPPEPPERLSTAKRLCPSCTHRCFDALGALAGKSWFPLAFMTLVFVLDLFAVELKVRGLVLPQVRGKAQSLYGVSALGIVVQLALLVAASNLTAREPTGSKVWFDSDTHTHRVLCGVCRDRAFLAGSYTPAVTVPQSQWRVPIAESMPESRP